MTTETSLTTLPSMAIAPTRKRAYSARNPLSQARADRVRRLVEELPVTPTIRQVFYILVGEHLIEKTDKGYKSLGRQLGAMRKGGELAYSALIDGTRDRKLNQTFGAPSEALAYARAMYRRNPWTSQSIVPEVWAEADTLSQMLWQVADPLSVPVVVCRGNSSLSQLYMSAGIIHKRWKKNRQCTAILYAGDFDPAGMDMSDGLHGRLVEVGAPGEAFVVMRIAITPGQIEAHQLRPHAPKANDARTPRFIARYGPGCVEVDALPPAALAAVVDKAIMNCVTDSEAWDEARRQQTTDREALEDMIAAESAALDITAARGAVRFDAAAAVQKTLQAMTHATARGQGVLTRADLRCAIYETEYVRAVLEQFEGKLSSMEPYHVS